MNDFNQQLQEGAPSVQQEIIRVPAAQVQMGLMPRSLDEGIKLATMLARSAFVPADYQGHPENIIVALQMGAEVGLAPMQALQSIAVINGRPSIWGDGLLALVMASPHYENHDEAFDDATLTATATFKRKGKVSPVVASFSKADAEKAKLWGKGGPWTNYPKRMLQMRARAFAIRDCFPDVLKGLSVAEEALDIPAPTVTVAPAPGAAAAGTFVDADAAPDGYDEFVTDLTAAADEGDEQFLPAFQAGKVEWRTRLTSKDSATWNRLKVRAGEVTAQRKAEAAQQAEPKPAAASEAKEEPAKPAIDPDDPFGLGVTKKGGDPAAKTGGKR